MIDFHNYLEMCLNNWCYCNLPTDGDCTVGCRQPVKTAVSGCLWEPSHWTKYVVRSIFTTETPSFFRSFLLKAALTNLHNSMTKLAIMYLSQLGNTARPPDSKANRIDIGWISIRRRWRRIDIDPISIPVFLLSGGWIEGHKLWCSIKKVNKNDLDRRTTTGRKSVFKHLLCEMNYFGIIWN